MTGRCEEIIWSAILAKLEPVFLQESAFWIQSMCSKQKIVHVRPELTMFEQISTILKFPPVASLLTERPLSLAEAISIARFD